jgi:hypothetical protein
VSRSVALVITQQLKCNTPSSILNEADAVGYGPNVDQSVQLGNTNVAA